jgi:hypothetical protein
MHAMAAPRRMSFKCTRLHGRTSQRSAATLQYVPRHSICTWEMDKAAVLGSWNEWQQANISCDAYGTFGKTTAKVAL